MRFGSGMPCVTTPSFITSLAWKVQVPFHPSRIVRGRSATYEPPGRSRKSAHSTDFKGVSRIEGCGRVDCCAHATSQRHAAIRAKQESAAHSIPRSDIRLLTSVDKARLAMGQGADAEAANWPDPCQCHAADRPRMRPPAIRSRSAARPSKSAASPLPPLARRSCLSRLDDFTLCLGGALTN